MFAKFRRLRSIYQRLATADGLTEPFAADCETWAVFVGRWTPEVDEGMDSKKEPHGDRDEGENCSLLMRRAYLRRLIMLVECLQLNQDNNEEWTRRNK